MPPRPHAAQHDSVAELPLVTEDATVTDATALDEDRRAAVGKRLELVLEAADVETELAVGDPAERRELVEQLVGEGRDHVARRISTLGGRLDREYPMLARIRVEPEAALDHRPGQYVGLRYADATRVYSIASSPTRRAVELCVRRVPGGHLSPVLCEDLAAGDSVTLRGPHGDFVLREPTDTDLAFLATGTGIAPLKSMVDSLFETGEDTIQGDPRDVWVFLGAAWRDDLPYHEAFQAYDREHDHFHYVPTLSREATLTEWAGETAYVQHAFLTHVDRSTVSGPIGRGVEEYVEREPGSDHPATIDPRTLEVYACGLNAMVFALEHAALSVGVPERRIDAEGYG